MNGDLIIAGLTKRPVKVRISAGLNRSHVAGRNAIARIEKNLRVEEGVHGMGKEVAGRRSAAKPGNALQRYFDLIPDEHTVRYPNTAITEIKDFFVLRLRQNPNRVACVAQERIQRRDWGRFAVCGSVYSRCSVLQSLLRPTVVAPSYSRCCFD